MNPYQILKQSIKSNPSLKYAMGVVGLASAIAVINGLGIQNAKMPVISILVLFGFMILILIFASISKSKDPQIRIAGYILVYTTLFVTCISSVLIVTAIVAGWPQALSQLLSK